jgi:DNA-binding NarL/FixJ family response regulator
MKVDQNKKTILLYQPGRYTLRPDSKQADAYFEKTIPCKFLVAETWDDFVLMLNMNPDLVGFHANLFNNEEVSTQVLIKTIENTFKLKNKQADIFVSINKRTSRDMIDMLRKTNIIGLQFGRADFGIEFSAESFKRLVEDRYHWPEDRISKLLEYNENKRPLQVYFHNDINSRVDPNFQRDAAELKAWSPCAMRICKSWSDLSLIIEERPQSITFHIDMVKRHGGTISEFMLMLETMFRYANVQIRPNLGVVIEADTHLSTVKELQKHRILAIIPSARSSSIEYSKKAITALLNNELFHPKEIINQLPGNQQKTKNKNSTALTDRQQEVFDLIAKRGLSNKQIARVLNISESTVKIHVSAVMKNLCVRNRTQLALTK